MKYIFEINNNLKNLKITFNETEEPNYDKSLFIEYNNMIESIKNNNNKKKIYKKYSIFNTHTHERIKKTNNNGEKYQYYNYILKKFNYYNEFLFYINSLNTLNDYSIINKNNDNIVVNNIYINNLTLIFNEKFYETSRNELELNLQKMILILLYNLDKYLNKNGNLMLRIYSITNYKTFLLFMLLLSHFKKAYIIYGSHVFLIGFKNNIDKNIIKNIFNNGITFNLNIDLNKNFNKLMIYLKYIFNIKIKRSIYILTNDVKNLDEIVLNYGLSTFLELGLYDKINNDQYDILIYNILTNNSNIFPYNYTLIDNFIKKYNKKINLLEINSSEGIYPIYLLKKYNNIYITSVYKNNIKNNYINNIINNYLKNNNMEIYYDNSIVDTLLKLKNNNKKYNIIVIYFTENINNNKELFKYSNLLTNNDSYIIIDYSSKGSIDCEKIYIKKNYLNYKKIKENLSLLILKKIIKN